MSVSIENKYEQLRKMALEVTPDRLGLTYPADRTVVYGIVMDWNLKNGTASTISFIQVMPVTTSVLVAVYQEVENTKI